MTDHIDHEVAAFARQLDALTLVDAQSVAEDVDQLLQVIIAAPDTKAVTGPILQFHVRHRDQPDYVEHVVLTAIAQYALHIATTVPTWQLSAATRRLGTLALACRVIGLGSSTAEGRRV